MTLQTYLSTLPGWVGTDEESNQRIQTLFGKFPPVRTRENAAVWDEKINFWRGVIHDCCKKGFLGNDIAAFEAKGLEAKFARRRLSPLCLQVVLADMMRTNDLVPLAQFQKPAGWASWAVSTLIVAPVAWGFSRMVGTPSKVAPAEGQFVATEVLKETSEAFTTLFERDAHYGVDHVIALSEFEDRFRIAAAPLGAKPSTLDLSLIQTYLQTTGKAAFSRNPAHPEQDLVKIRPSQDNSKQPITITETDRGIVQLKATVKRLNVQVEALELEINSLTSQSKECLRMGQKPRAMYFIRRRKLVANLLEKRIASLETIQGVIGKIRGAETEAEIFTAFRLGTSSLSSFMAESGLTADKVEEGMEKLQDTLADQAEIDQAIESGQSAINSSSGVDNDELEKELDELLEEQFVERMQGLPSVPSALPFEAPPVKGKKTAAEFAEIDAELEAMLQEEQRASAPRKRMADPMLA